MRTIRQKVYGQLIHDGARATLWLAQDETPQAGITPHLFYLRYALTVRGPESLLFPAFALDDWGNTVRKLKLYPWLRENGDYQPRSEVFGFTAGGAETQFFLRELELHFKYPTFIYPDLETALPDGVRLESIVVLEDSAETLQQIKPPPGTKAPLRRASVHWWQLPPGALPDLSPNQLIPSSG